MAYDKFKFLQCSRVLKEFHEINPGSSCIFRSREAKLSQRQIPPEESQESPLSEYPRKKRTHSPLALRFPLNPY